MKIKDSDICNTCKVVETIEHFFFHCKNTNCLWEEVNKDIATLFGHQFNITEEQVILGINKNTDITLNLSHKIYERANLILLVAKQCISKFKYGSHPNLKILYEYEMKWRKLN